MITLTKEEKQSAVESIRGFFLDEFEQEISELKAVLLFDFFLGHLAPAVYNKAIADASRYMRERIEDMDGSLFETETHR